MPTLPWPAEAQAVELDKSWRLLNHGPTVMVSAAHKGRRNLMSAAWNTALDFGPPKVAVVIDKSTATRALVEASGAFALNLPGRALADLAYTVGSCSQRDVGDKFERFAIDHFAAQRIAAPLVAGCAAWLECRVMPEPDIAKTYDLFFGEVVAAWADVRVFSAGRWSFDNSPESLLTLHHTTGGQFFSPARGLQAKVLDAASALDTPSSN